MALFELFQIETMVIAGQATGMDKRRFGISEAWNPMAVRAVIRIGISAVAEFLEIYVNARDGRRGPSSSSLTCAREICVLKI